MRRHYNADCPSDGLAVTPDTPMSSDELLTCWATLGARAVNRGHKTLAFDPCRLIPDR